MTALRFVPLAAFLLALPLAARADETPDATPDQLQAAQEVVTGYLEAVKAKKWDVAKKAIHPKRLAEIADQAKRTGVEKHALAPWAKVKESYLTKFEVSGAAPSGKGAVVVSSTEDHFSVEDKGVDEGVQAEYLVVPLEGRWFIVDRRLGAGQFPSGKVAASYKGFFEGEYTLPAEPEKPAKAAKKSHK
jgi:hypothetical protein